MSYISPIKLNTIPDMEEGWTDKIAKYIAGETDKLVLESCVKVACDVDEEELLKALQYDRGQYEKGYADGKRDAAPRWVRCEERLPDDSWQRVLATDGKELWLAFCYGRIGGDEAKVYWKRAKDGMDVYAGFLHGVTHWMPLPEPPQEES